MFDSPTPSGKCTSKVSSITTIVLTLLVILSLLPISLNPPRTVIHVVYIQNIRGKHVTDTKFLSVALDSSLLAEGFPNFDMKSERLRNMMRNLSPGYLRIGGTTSDRLLFARNVSDTDISDFQLRQENFTFTAKEWTDLYNLAFKTGFSLIFDLNSLTRNSNGSWNHQNALDLIKFSHENDMIVIWQLGNEPNSYKHTFNVTVNATQLVKDYCSLRRILNNYNEGESVLVAGPDVTNPAPENTKSISYLNEFLMSGGGYAVDAITFHQYYFNGKTAFIRKFIDIKIYDLLIAQIDLVKSLVSYHGYVEKPIWLSETSDGYDGGTRGCSDRYIGTFIWLDKLGIAAKMDLKVVIRQTLYKGYYALIDNNYNPTPSYWISVIYKKFVGPEVVPCIQATSEKVRLYCHCTNRKYKRSSVTLFGFNLKDRDAFVRIEGLTHPGRTLLTLEAYILSPFITLFTKDIYLNGELLLLSANGELPQFKPVVLSDVVHVVIPPFNSVFFVIPSDIAICN